MKITFSETTTKADTLVFLVGEDKKFSTALSALDNKTGGFIAHAMEGSAFTGKKGKCFTLAAPAAAGVARITLAGTGKNPDSNAYEQIGGAIAAHLNQQRAKAATIVLDGAKEAEAAAHVAYGAYLRSYRFDKYFTTKKPDEKPTLASIMMQVKDTKAAQNIYADLEAIAEGVCFARDLITEPSNIIYPETLAAACQSLSKLGVEVKVLGVKEMQKLGMGALLGVGQGSVRESKLVTMHWNGDKKGKSAPVAFVGKGVTFDTGGISIKPANGMEEMKHDMGGAGAVIGALRALAKRKAKANVVGVVGLVENMPDGNAQRPGDVVTSMSGQTIEVLNTDAEGRLVLSDALWYTQQEFKPRAIVDLATLTGAIVVALGSKIAGLFSNDDKLSKQLLDAGLAVDEHLWRLPLNDDFDKHIDSDIADMQNIGREREAGSITAAQFLQRFIQKGTPWAHLDIAGTCWTKKDMDICPKGATAFGVRLLNQLVEANYEEK